jgi:hypothetical protein
MTPLTLTEIQNAVLRLMDEHGGNAQFMSGNAMDETRAVIGQVAEDSIRKIHLQAPVAMLDSVSLPQPWVSSVFTRNERYVCRVQLPDDFLRLIMLRLFSSVLIYSSHRPVFLIQELLVDSDLVRFQLRLNIKALMVDQVAAAVRCVQL